MKAFTERSPYRIGAVALLVMALVAGLVLFTNRSVFASTYPVTARFANASGIGPGTQVLEAGVVVGSVGSVRLDGNHVAVTLDLNSGTQLPSHTAADIQVQTLLGNEDVAVEPVSGWSRLLRPGAVITDTSVPTQIQQLQNDAGNLFSQTDTEALNQVIEDLATITQGKQRQVAEIITGLAKLTTTVDDRSAAVSSLIDSANQVSTTLADRDQSLVSAIDGLSTVVGGLAGHSSDLASLITNIDQAAGQTSDLLGRDQPQLNSLLQNLHTVLQVLAGHQDDLAEGISYLGASLKGFASVGYSGVDDTPNSWANIYVNPLTLIGGYGVLGPCGALDQALTAALGPDPLACDAQTGPLPQASSSPNGGGSGLSQLFDPVAGGS